MKLPTQQPQHNSHQQQVGHVANHQVNVQMGSPVQSQEQMIWTGYPSMACVVPPLFKHLVFIILSIIVYLRISSFQGSTHTFESDSVFMILGYILLIFLIYQVYSIVRVFLRQFNTRYTFTTQRIIMQTGILNIETFQMELFRLKDFTFHKSLWARMMGYSNVLFISTDRIKPNMYIWGLIYGDQIINSVRSYAQVARSEAGQVNIHE